MFNKTGRFDAKALDVGALLRRDGRASEKPIMTKLYTEAFLPNN